MDGSSLVAPLSQVSTADPRELDRVCQEVAVSLCDAGIAPPYSLAPTDFAADPFLMCADRYWRLRFRRCPSMATAVECARWLYEHAPDETLRTQIEEAWALGYAWLARATEETPTEINAFAAIDGSMELTYFISLFHATKLCAAHRVDELDGFLESSPIALASGPRRGRAPFTALRAFAAYGSRRLTTEYATDLLNHAWYAPHRTRHTVEICLSALAAAIPFVGQGELLRDRAREAATEWPESHLSLFHLARGHHLCGEHDAALDAVDLAWALLSAEGYGELRDAHERYLAQRGLIVEARERAAEYAVRERQQAQQTRTYRRAQARLESATGPLTCIIVAFAVAIVFTVTSFPQKLDEDLALGDRMEVILTLGAVLLGLSGLLIFISYLLLHSRQRAPRPVDDGDRSR